MRRPALCPLMATFAFSSLVVAAPAKTAPPIKPGLWQVHSEREVDGQKAPDASARMKNMSPERRAQVEAMMKQHGVAADGAGGGQVCYTSETLGRSPWADQQTNCQVAFSRRDATSWKWHSSCPEFAAEGDGEATFPDREHYTVKVTSVSKMGGKVRNSRITMTGKWLGADCGAVKPLAPTP